VRQRNKVRWVLVILLLGVSVSGCLSGHEQSGETTVSSSSQSGGIFFPDNVTFIALLTVKSGNTTIQNCSYSARVDYISMNAEINRSVVYHPHSGGLYGNWHKERIVITNGTSIRVFVVPPAMWMPAANNSSNAIKLALYARNPYYILWNFVNSSGAVGGDGEYEITIPPNVSRELLWAVDPELNLSGSVSLKGVVVVDEGIITLAELEGCVNSICYSLKLEVKE